MIEQDSTVRTRPPMSRLPPLEEEASDTGSLARISSAADLEDTSVHRWSKLPPHTPTPVRSKRTLSRRWKVLVRLSVIALVLTLVFAAGIAAGSLLIAWVATQMQSPGTTHTVHLPVQTGTIVSAAGGLAMAVLGVRYGAAKFSKYKYPHFSCEACKGGGKDFEPRWLRLLRWGRRRAWRKCPDCDGNPTENR